MSDQEVRAILERRAAAGLVLNVAPRPILEQIATLADGDARCGIEMLEVAAQTARPATRRSRLRMSGRRTMPPGRRCDSRRFRS
ncbi:hypothetical protein [Haloglomus litoreum]|uniref:hypothetical protein n=1 Tax=Haloglomus litoreum TaxID=3034026 RepID=UPI003B228B86